MGWRGTTCAAGRGGGAGLGAPGIAETTTGAAGAVLGLGACTTTGTAPGVRTLAGSGWRGPERICPGRGAAGTGLAGIPTVRAEGVGCTGIAGTAGRGGAGMAGSGAAGRAPENSGGRIG